MIYDEVSSVGGEFIKTWKGPVAVPDDGFELALPNLVITGTKKCGTYALLMFLLEHPKIQGAKFASKEFLFYDTNRFELDLAYLLKPLIFMKENEAGMTIA